MCFHCVVEVGWPELDVAAVKQDNSYCSAPAQNKTNVSKANVNFNQRYIKNVINTLSQSFI